MEPVQVCNIALAEIGSRILLNSLTDNSPQAVVANTFYQPKIQMLLRSANWDFARAQRTLTTWKQATVNGVASATPPPQPWLFSYLYPPDCLKARFILPTMPVAAPGTPLTTTPTNLAYPPPVPTAIPFVPGTDVDVTGNPIRVILTNLQAAQLIYTRDLSQIPDTWDPLFMSAATAFLASYFINALARNAAQYQAQVAIAKSVLDQARQANGNEALNSIDRTPDWMAARRSSGINWGWNSSTPAWGYGGGWDQAQFPCGLTY